MAEEQSENMEVKSRQVLVSLESAGSTKTAPETKEMAFLSPLTVNLPPLPEKHCIMGCKFNGTEKCEMIRCSLCWRWFHLKCVELKKSESEFSYWPCLICRQISTKVQTLECVIENLTCLNKQLMEKVTNQNVSIETLLSQNTAVLLKLEEQEKQLNSIESRVRDVLQDKQGTAEEHVNSKARRATYAEVTSAENDETDCDANVLLGNSLIRKAENVKTADGIGVETRSKSGATYNDLRQKLTEMEKKPNVKGIYIVGGTRDIGSDVKMDKVIEDCTALIAKAKTITSHVVVSSVLPRSDRDVSERTRQMNNALITICDDTNATFVSHDKNFLYQDGSADESVFYKDGVHLNDRGLRRLRAFSVRRTTVQSGVSSAGKLVIQKTSVDTGNR